MITGVFVDGLRHDLVGIRCSACQPRPWDGAAIRAHSERFSPRAFRDALCSIVDEVSGS